MKRVISARSEAQISNPFVRIPRGVFSAARRNLFAIAAVAILGVAVPHPADAAKPARPPGKPGGGGTTCTETSSFAPRSSAELQAALDCAGPGATITLDAALVYEGNFTLRHKPVAYEADGITVKRITMQTSGLANLPASKRVSAGDWTQMASLKVPSGSTAPLLTTELKTLTDGTRRAASHYQLVGLRFVSDHWVSQLVRLGTGTETVTPELPDDITFDRSYFAGSAGEGTKQGLVANGTNVVVTNSYFKDFKDTANDAQAIIIWNGAGPFLIKNNYLEGSGENMMVGGGDPTITNLVPADIVIIGNYFFKPLGWTSETSTQSGAARGQKWRIKNLFELKNAEWVQFEGNVLENNWIQADQQGFAINISPRNQSGGCPWCKVQNVTFKSNLIKNSIAGIKLLATDYTFSSGQLQDIEFSNNLLVNINAGAIAGPAPGDRAGRLLQIMNPYPSFSTKASPTGPIKLVMKHNTAFSSREVTFSVSDPVSGVSFRNNVVRHNRCTTFNDCGMSGEGTGPGDPTFDRWFISDLDVAGNTLFSAGDNQAAGYSQFPTNSFPASVTFKSSCDNSNAISLTTGLPAIATAPADYNVVVAGDCGTYVRVPDESGLMVKVGADWDVLKPLIQSAISGR